MVAQRAEIMMRTNPFTYGNPISHPNRFFGRKHEIEQVFSRLGNVEFESSSLVGERRVGKTSLLNYLAHPDVRRSQGFDLDKFIFVYMDLQMVDSETTPLRLWQRLLRQIAHHCQDDHIRQVLEETQNMGFIDTFALVDIFDSIDKNDLYIALLLDEFEHVTENRNFGPDFFYGLRSLAIHHHLALITSSRRDLVDLCHSDTIRSSPFFNIFANINVRLFTTDEARLLIAVSLSGTGVSFTEAEYEIIFRLAGYHPYFLQIACSLLFDISRENLELGERKNLLFKNFNEKAAPQLENYWHNADDQEKIVLTALALLEQNGKLGERTFFSQKQLQALYARSDQLLTRLEGRGLLTHIDDRYSLFGASFGAWIRHEITNTTPDHQSYEEWLVSNKSAMQVLSTMAKKDVDEILPKISSRYRDMIINWVSDPRNLITVAELLKGVLGIH
jgi:AAA+ ATPase superfamily predicted ATPase